MVTTSVDRYTNGDYLKSTGSWHEEDAPFKARQVMKMIRRNSLLATSVCELGCGAGAVLANLQNQMVDSTVYVGYDISPQAIEIGKKYTNERLRLHVGEVPNSRSHFDLLLAIDVIEHVEDCFSFLRKARQLAEHKMYHIPLDLSCSSVIRDLPLRTWRDVGHLHCFSLSTALELIRYTGHEILDFFYTPAAIQAVQMTMKTRLGNMVRRVLPPGICARVLGGYEVLILAR